MMAFKLTVHLAVQALHTRGHVQSWVLLWWHSRRRCLIGGIVTSSGVLLQLLHERIVLLALVIRIHNFQEM